MKKVLLVFIAMMTMTVAMAQQVTHVIQRGETLESIAQKYQVTVDAIKQANPDTVNMIYVGMKLVVPVNGETIKHEKTTPPPTRLDNNSAISSQQVIQSVSNNDLSNSSTTTDLLFVKHIRHIDYFNTLKSGDKGLYGVGVDMVRGEYNGLGLSLRLFTNVLLEDIDFSHFSVAFGPNYYFTLENIGYVVFPITPYVFMYSEIDYNEHGVKNRKDKFGTGILFSPYIALGSKGGICVGPTWNCDFVTGGSTWGGYVGIWF